MEPGAHYSVRRRDMVRKQISARDIQDTRVLEAMRKVAREEFVPKHLRHAAYDDQPLPIDEGQTISQPYIVAFMAEALHLGGTERVLEIGTGSGYAAAVLSLLASEVYTVECIPALASHARQTLQRLGYRTVHVVEGDGTLGWPAAAPYDAIVVTAQGPRIPPSLLAQLKPGGRLLMPVHNQQVGETLVRLTRTYNQQVGETLVRLTRTKEGRDITEKLLPVRFVPLIGAEGWSRDQKLPLDDLGLHPTASGRPNT